MRLPVRGASGAAATAGSATRHAANKVARSQTSRFGAAEGVALSQSVFLSIVAVVASVILLLQFQNKLLPIIALVASGLEALIGFGVVHLSFRDVPLWLILGGALAVVSVLMFLKVSGKTAVAAATCGTLVGALQVLVELRVLR